MVVDKKNVATLQEVDFWSAAWEKSRGKLSAEKRIRKGKEEIEFWNRLVRSICGEAFFRAVAGAAYKRCSGIFTGEEC